MIGGLSPIVLWNFPVQQAGVISNALSGIPLVKELAVTDIGVIVPVYLENPIFGLTDNTILDLRGLRVLRESKSISIATDVDGKLDTTKKASVEQKPLISSVTIEMVANKESIIINILSAIADIVFTKAASVNGYGISYFNDTTVVLNAKLEDFSVDNDFNKDLKRMILKISKASEKTANVTDTTATSVEKVTQVTPPTTGVIG